MSRESRWAFLIAGVVLAVALAYSFVADRWCDGPDGGDDVATAVFDFTDAKSGKITKLGLAYTAATGAANCQTGQNRATGEKWYAYFSFDTSSLPSGAEITKVEFYQVLSGVQPYGDPDNLRLKYSLGTFIGDDLDGDAGEWNAGTWVHEENTEQNDTWIDISNQADPCALVNTEGDTDLKLWDDSTQGLGHHTWGTDFNHGRDVCQLRVTYTGPDIVEADELEVEASVKDVTVVPGPVSKQMDALAAQASAKDVTVLATYAATVDKLRGAVSVKDVTVVPGAVVVSVGSQGVSATVHDIARLGGQIPRPPDGRLVEVKAEDRFVDVHDDGRFVNVHAEDRFVSVHAEDRFVDVHAEDRFVDVHGGA